MFLVLLLLSSKSWLFLIQLGTHICAGNCYSGTKALGLGVAQCFYIISEQICNIALALLQK